MSECCSASGITNRIEIAKKPKKTIQENAQKQLM